METLHDITEILEFRRELGSVNNVEDFMRMAGEDGEASGDREVRGPGPRAPKIGSKTLELILS